MIPNQTLCSITSEIWGIVAGERCMIKLSGDSQARWLSQEQRRDGHYDRPFSTMSLPGATWLLHGNGGAIRFLEAVYSATGATIRPDGMDNPAEGRQSLIVAILIAKIRAAAGLVR